MAWAPIPGRGARLVTCGVAACYVGSSPCRGERLVAHGGQPWVRMPDLRPKPRQGRKNGIRHDAGRRNAVSFVSEHILAARKIMLAANSIHAVQCLASDNTNHGLHRAIRRNSLIRKRDSRGLSFLNCDGLLPHTKCLVPSFDDIRAWRQVFKTEES